MHWNASWRLSLQLSRTADIRSCWWNHCSVCCWLLDRGWQSSWHLACFARAVEQAVELRMSAMIKAHCFDEKRVLPSYQRQKSFHSHLESRNCCPVPRAVICLSHRIKYISVHTYVPQQIFDAAQMPWVQQKWTCGYNQNLCQILMFPDHEVTKISFENQIRKQYCAIIKKINKHIYNIRHCAFAPSLEVILMCWSKAKWHLNICQERSSAAMQEHRPWLLISTKAATRLGWVAGTWAHYIDGPATTHTHSPSGV